MSALPLPSLPSDRQPPSQATRRALLGNSGRVLMVLAALGLLPAFAQTQALAYPQRAFDAKTLDELVQALGMAAPIESSAVSISGPDVAENGAAVPLSASATLSGVRRLLLAVEKNPSMLSAVFELTDKVDAQISVRLKMNQSSRVFAVAWMADGRALYAAKDIQVILGGCSV